MTEMVVVWEQECTEASEEAESPSRSLYRSCLLKTNSEFPRSDSEGSAPENRIQETQYGSYSEVHRAHLVLLGLRVEQPVGKEDSRNLAFATAFAVSVEPKQAIDRLL